MFPNAKKDCLIALVVIFIFAFVLAAVIGSFVASQSKDRDDRGWKVGIVHEAIPVMGVSDEGLLEGFDVSTTPTPVQKVSSHELFREAVSQCFGDFRKETETGVIFDLRGFGPERQYVFLSKEQLSIPATDLGFGDVLAEHSDTGFTKGSAEYEMVKSMITEKIAAYIIEVGTPVSFDEVMLAALSIPGIVCESATTMPTTAPTTGPAATQASK